MYSLGVEHARKADDDSSEKGHNYINRTGEFSPLTPKGASLDKVVYFKSINMPEWAQKNPHKYWLAADKYSAKNARLSRDYVLALPKQLSLKQNIELSEKFLECIARERKTGGRLPCSHAIHNGFDNNPHLHAMISDKVLFKNHYTLETWFKKYYPGATENGRSGARRCRDFLTKKALKLIRRLWQKHVNRALRKAGFKVVVSCKTLRAQGIERPPKRKTGKLIKKSNTPVFYRQQRTLDFNKLADEYDFVTEQLNRLKEEKELVLKNRQTDDLNVSLLQRSNNLTQCYTFPVNAKAEANAPKGLTENVSSQDKKYYTDREEYIFNWADLKTKKQFSPLAKSYLDFMYEGSKKALMSLEEWVLLDKEFTVKALIKNSCSISVLKNVIVKYSPVIAKINKHAYLEKLIGGRLSGQSCHNPKPERKTVESSTVRSVDSAKNRNNAGFAFIKREGFIYHFKSNDNHESLHPLAKVYLEYMHTHCRKLQMTREMWINLDEDCVRHILKFSHSENDIAVIKSAIKQYSPASLFKGKEGYVEKLVKDSMPKSTLAHKKRRKKKRDNGYDNSFGI